MPSAPRRGGLAPEPPRTDTTIRRAALDGPGAPRGSVRSRGSAVRAGRRGEARTRRAISDHRPVRSGVSGVRPASDRCLGPIPVRSWTDLGDASLWRAQRGAAPMPAGPGRAPVATLHRIQALTRPGRRSRGAPGITGEPPGRTGACRPAQSGPDGPSRPRSARAPLDPGGRGPHSPARAVAAPPPRGAGAAPQGVPPAPHPPPRPPGRRARQARWYRGAAPHAVGHEPRAGPASSS